MDNLIAYKGEVTLDKSQWDNVSGMTIVLQLEQRPHEMTAANPFKKFTKMRKNRVGTRFDAVLTMPDESVAYDDELMLKGWADGTNGWKVTFWINATDRGEHPFIGYPPGQVFSFAAVELDDDNEVIDQVKREKVHKPRKQSLSNYAALLCRSEDFVTYLKFTYDHDWLQYGPSWTDIVPAWMRETLSIESRSELDSNEEVANRFHTMIREPYAAWMDKRG